MSRLAEFLHARDFLLASRTDYETAYRCFSWPRLDEFNWALDYFDVTADGNRATALWITGESGAETRISFAEMRERSNCAANYLRRLGASRGDRALVMLGNDPPLWEILLAIFKLGAVAIPATTLLTAEDVSDRLERGQVRHVFSAAAHAHKFCDTASGYTRVAVGGAVPGWHSYEDAYSEPAAFRPDAATGASDPLLTYFTSGTTARPKLVHHSHQSYPVGHLSTMYWIGVAPGNVHWNISSPGWAKHAWSCVFSPWNAGGTVFVYNCARFQSAAVVGALHRYPINTLCAPPTVWRMLIQESLGEKPAQLRELVSAGEPLNPPVIEAVRNAWGLTIRDGYGQTESTAMVGNTPGQAVKPGSMGRPLPGYRVELLDTSGRAADEGEVSIDLAGRPVGLMLGYGSVAESQTAFRDGYYRTGDIALRDAVGYLTCVGRSDDVFKASDYRISPFELESILLEHPAVSEAAVVPSPDLTRFVVPKAYVVVGPEYSPGEALARDIFAFLRRHTAPYKRVRRLEFAELPKTHSGKIRRTELRRIEQGRAEVLKRNAREFFEEDFPDV